MTLYSITLSDEVFKVAWQAKQLAYPPRTSDNAIATRDRILCTGFSTSRANPGWSRFRFSRASGKVKRDISRLVKNSDRLPKVHSGLLVKLK